MGLVTVTAKDKIGTPSTRRVDTTAPLTGGGDLSANRTLAVSDATTLAVGVVRLAGDLGGTADDPDVLKINGVSVTGTPSAGYSIVATGAAAATWQAAGSVEVPNSRTISTTLPLTGGGDLSANRTLGVNDATSTTVGVVSLAGNFAGSAAVPLVDGLTADSITVQNANLTHKGVWSTVGLRIGDATAPTEKLEVVGDTTVLGRVKVSKVGNTFPMTNVGAHLLLENATGGQTGLVFSFAGTPGPMFRADNSGNFSLHLASYLQLYQGSDASQPLVNVSATGNVFIGGGAGAAGSEKLDVLGRAKIGVGAGKVFLDSLIGATASYGAVWLGAITPSASNYALYSSGSVTNLNSTAETEFVINGAMMGIVRATGWGLGVPSGTNPAERLHVVGNICIDTATVAPKFYQRDNVTNGATGASLTIQSQNATGTTSNGGALNIVAGAGTSTDGGITITRGVTPVITMSGNGTSKFVIITAGSSGNGLFFDSDFYRFRLSDGATYKGLWTSVGLRIGDGTTPTERLEVLGNIKYDTAVTAPKLFQADNVTNGATAQPLLVQAQNATGTTSIGGSATLQSGAGVANPGPLELKRGANIVLTANANYSDNSYQTSLYGGPVNGLQLVSDALYFGLNAGGWKGRWNTVGLRIGDGAAATEKLEVTGNIKYDTTVTAPKLYQADNVTNGATAQPLAVQAQNATGTTSIGGTLALKSGTGTTRAGDITIGNGATIIGAFSSRVLGFTMHTSGAPTSSNWLLSSGGTLSIYNAISQGHEFRVAGAAIANIGPNGLKLDTTQTYPTERLEVVGNSLLQGNNTLGVAAITSAHTLRGSIVSTTRSTSADLVVDTTTKDLTIFVDTTAATKQITLPTPTDGRIVWIKRKAGGNYVSVITSSGWIEKSAVASIRLVTYVPPDSNNGIHPYLSLQADGTNWYIMRHFSIELILT